jgi:hypothetical protein
MKLINYLFLTSDADINVQVLLNGFPLIQDALYKDIETPFLVNSLMIKGLNTIEIIINAEQLENVINATANIKVQIKGYEKDEIVTPEDGHIIPFIREEDEQDDRFAPFLVAAMNNVIHQNETLVFEQNQYDNANLLVGESLNLSEKDLKSYGESLIKLFAAKDVVGFVNEYKYKLPSLALDRGLTEDQLLPHLPTELQFIMGHKLVEAITNDGAEVQISSWCNGRLYELYISNDIPLITTVEGDDGVIEVPIFVSTVNGQIKIVR